MTTKTNGRVNIEEVAQAEEKLAVGVQIFTFEDGIFEFSSMENYDKTDSDAQTLYENILRVECNSQTEYFATININHRKLPAFNASNKYKIRLVAKKDCFGKFRANDNRERTAEAGRIYIIDITNDYKSSYEHGTLLSLGLYHVDEDMRAEFFTSGEYTPVLIIAANGVSDEILNEGIIDLDASSQLLVKHYYKSLGLPDGVTHMTDLFARNSIVTICSFPAEKSLMNMNIQHVFRSGEKNIGYGTGFKLNLDEYIKNVNGKDYYCDALGNKYWIKGEGVIVRDIIYTAEVPATVKELYAYKNASIKPVKWIYSDNIIKGFGSDGNLIMISDSCKNCIVINRAVGKISSIERYNGEQCTAQMNFSYNRTSGNLSQINFGGSEGVAFEYNGNGNLSLMTFTTGKMIYVYYDTNGNISKIQSSEGYESVIEEKSGKVKVSVKSARTEIPDGRESSALPEIYSDEIEFKEGTVTVSGEGYAEYYGFNEDGLLTSYVREENSLVVQAEQYNEIPNVSQKVVKCMKQALNKNSYQNFVFIEGETTTLNYNEHGQPKRAAVTNTPVKQETYRNAVTKYNYGNNDVTGANLCKSKETEITYKIGNSEKKYKVITTFEYDNATNLPKKKTTYTDGEETAIGKSIEEYEYDKQGNCTKVTSYNSLETSTKFVTERTFDKYGRITSQKDETGGYRIGYGYKEDTKLLTEKTYADGTGEEYGYKSDRLNSVAFKNGTGGKLTNEIEYTYGEVTKLTDGSNAINFRYDSERRIKSIKVGSDELETITYTDTETMQGQTITNAKGETFALKKDKANRKLMYYYNNSELCTISYDKGGKVINICDGVSGKECDYFYNTDDTLSKVTTGDNKEEYEYTEYGEISKITYSGEVIRTESYTYEDNSKRRITKTDYVAFTVEPTYDNQGRVTEKKIKVNGNEVYSETYQYLTVESYATRKPCAVGYIGGSMITYGYDGHGNITRITDGNGGINYTYDKYGRLIKEENITGGTIKEYAYDKYGNITTKTVKQRLGNTYVNTESAIYTYTNGRLTGGIGTVTYDRMGNPTVYRGNSMTWTRGGKLKSYKNCSFEYDGLGRRTSKTVNGKKSEYTYDSEDRIIKCSDGTEYYYDGSGVIAFKYNGILYIYKKDVQGNINGILDSNGKEVVQYDYDAWGKHKVSGNTTLGNLNPYRYRGYYYDTETGLYYLQTRYYDPEVGRFLSPDSVQYADTSIVHGLNLYAYCGNDPVNYVDPSGRFVISSILLGCIIVGAVAGAVVGGYIAGDKASEAGATGWELFGWTLLGVVGGGVAGGAIGAAVGLAAPAVGGMLSGSLALAGGGSVAAGVAGTAAVAGLGLIATNVWFASDRKPGNNQAQNKQIRSAIRELGYNPSDPKIKDIINQVEKYIRKNHLNYGYKDLLELLIDFLP